MKHIIYFFIIILIACSPSSKRVLVQNIGEAQGTNYHIQYLSDGGINYKNQIDSILLEIDSSLSIYKQYSLISKLNSGEDIRTDSFFNIVYRAAKRVYNESKGNFDCSVFPLVKEFGFYQDKLGEDILLDSINIRKIIKYVGFDKTLLISDSLILPKGMSLDFNSIAQGYTVDVITDFLESKGDSNYLVEIGGELKAKGKNADRKIWRVGVDKPSEEIDNANRFQFILNLENKSLATSGNYRKFYKQRGVRYSHTISPFSGFPSQNRLLSVSVIHDECMLADAYATTFMVMGVRETKVFIKNRLDIEVYLIFTDKDNNWKTYISPNMKERIIN